MKTYKIDILTKLELYSKFTGVSNMGNFKYLEIKQHIINKPSVEKNHKANFKIFCSDLKWKHGMSKFMGFS